MIKSRKIIIKQFGFVNKVFQSFYKRPGSQIDFRYKNPFKLKKMGYTQKPQQTNMEPFVIMIPTHSNW